MAMRPENEPPRWYWLVAVLGLLWNLIGLAAFVGQLAVDPDTLPAAQREFYAATPAWATAAFATAVGGVIGCIALLLRRRWAMPVLTLSLLGIVVQVAHSVFVGGGAEVFGPAAFVLPAATLTIAAALIGFARLAMRRGWTG